MKIDIYFKYRDLIWRTLIITAAAVGIFVNTFYGFLVTLLIGVHFYISFCYETDSNFTQLDVLGVSFVATLIHWCLYGAIIVLTSIFVDTRTIETKEVFEIKYLENEKFVISKNNTIQIIDDAKLYWECRAKNCTEVIETKTRLETENTIFAPNLPHKASLKYSIE